MIRADPKPNLRRALWVIVRASLLLGFVSACAAVAQPMTGTAREQVLAYAEPATDNLMAGYNRGDYAATARNFDDAMKKAMNEAAFNTTRAMLQDKLGAYQSRAVSSVFNQDQFVTVVYAARFEKESEATMRVVFDDNDAHTISGWWLDSPKLRGR